MLTLATLLALHRRSDWFLRRVTTRRLFNGLASAVAYGTRASWPPPWPLALKIDVSPACNLSCLSCIHAEAGTDALLQKQQFSGKRMSPHQFRTIVDEVKGHVSALSLYYMGDPFAHPDLGEMCGVASDAGLNVHLSTNFSFRLSDARLRAIIESGVSHLTVCVDGFTQETYERTRRGGHLAWVLHNLEFLCTMRRALNRRTPRIEVQYLKYRHNISELSTAKSWLERIGVDSIVDRWGMVSNCVELDPSRYRVLRPKRARALPLCPWPYNSMVIRFDGEALPCCNHRVAAQYVEPTTTWGLGNVITSGVREVWRSEGYRRLRRAVSAREREPSPEEFCYGCSALFETTGVNRRTAPEFGVDEAYAP